MIHVWHVRTYIKIAINVKNSIRKLFAKIAKQDFIYIISQKK